MSGRITQGQTQWDAFLAKWSESRLRELTLDEYYGAEGDDSFYSWLRDHTNELGQFKEGPLSAGVRPRGENASSEPGTQTKIDQHHIWYSLLGNTANEAFIALKQELLVAVDAVRSGDLHGMAGLQNAPGALVWKVAFLYQDQRRPLVLPFYTLKQLKHVAPDFAGNNIQLQQQLMSQRGTEPLLSYAERLFAQATEVQTMLAHFASAPGLAKSLLNAEQRGLFCRMAKAVHGQGWDWWTVTPTSADSIHCGRKPAEENSTSAVLAELDPRKDGLQIRLSTHLNADNVWQPLTASLVEQVEAPDFASVFRTQQQVDRAGLWPKDYLESTANPVAALQPSEDGTQMNNPPALNQILYGPPGTGKTYETIDAALAILAPDALVLERAERKARFDELVVNGQIRVTTFHQSFSYEDFVEGLRADNGEDGQLRYEVVDGVFKSLCEAAAAKVTQQAQAPIDITGRRIWKMSLGNTLGDDAYIYDECISSGYALLGYGDQVDFTGCKDRQAIHQRFVEAGYTLAPDAYNITAVATFLLKVKPGDLVVVTDGNHKFRAIGEFTGDYQSLKRADADEGYGQCRTVNWLRVYSPSLPYELLMSKIFSQATIYQLRDGSIDLAKLSGLLGAPVPVSGQSQQAVAFKPGDRFGAGYEVVSASAELVELRKPNEKSLPLGMSLLNTLADYVRGQRISLADIRDKRVFERVPDTKLDPFLVNGYNSILSALVEHVLQAPVQREALAPSAVTSNARVLIIDEINRGNISRIFGELITLIEPSKRAGADEALSVVLPYSKKPFSVPSNLYLIGTMNTADRSLAGLDIALRRRFTFREMPPRPELLDNLNVGGVNIGQLLRIMNQRIEVLLDRDHCLGHAYFMPLLTDNRLELLESIFRNQVLPLLQEYFFEDWQHIQWVLNDHRKASQHCFLSQSTRIADDLFGADVAVTAHNLPWHINDEAFECVEAYLGIIDHQAMAPELGVARQAEHGSLTIRQLSSGSIEVWQGDKCLPIAKPSLRDVAGQLGLALANGQGSIHNTRTLGRKVIEALTAVNA
jgi:5-methylcytosine-specific restriction protein B